MARPLCSVDGTTVRQAPSRAVASKELVSPSVDCEKLLYYAWSDVGGVAKWSKAAVCKTAIRRFESARRLQGSPMLPSCVVTDPRTERRAPRGNKKTSELLLRTLNRNR
jgi:hypothetical protein